VASACNIPLVAVLCYSLRPSGSTPPMAYAPYDVPQWQHSLCFRPRRSPVVTRLWLPPYDVPPVVALPCGIRPVRRSFSGSTPFASAPGGSTSMASALRRSPGGSTCPVAVLPRWLPPRTAFPQWPAPL